MATQTRSQVLRAMADVIRTEGWVQGTYFDSETGNVCLIGARNTVFGGYPSDYPDKYRKMVDAVTEVLALLVANYPPGVSPVTQEGIVISWNDVDGRTVDEVLRLIKQAETKCDQEDATPVDMLVLAE